MKHYVIYEEVPHPEGHVNRFYHCGNGEVTPDPKAAKIYKAANWLEFIITILQLIVKTFGNSKLKYTRL